jgi:membrane-associated phospholipid phosphatase
VRETPLFGSRAIGIAIALYIGLVLFASFHFNISLTADRVAVLLVIAALGTGRIRSFLRDWSAFVVVILGWQVLQGMSHSFTHFKPHVTEMIVVDRFLFFGHVPTIWLQSHLWNADNVVTWQGVLPDMAGRSSVHHYYFHGVLHWYDVAATAFYTMHFVFPLAVAFVLWFWKRDIFLEYMAGFMLLALAGFATYVLFPAAPPWVAANWYHDMPHVTRIFQYGVNFFGGDQSYSTITQWTWQHGGYDIFGAVPSEHAAFPFLGFLFVRKAWPRAGWLLLVYCLSVWISVMYLGEHYAADVLVGVLYAGVVYAGVQVAMRRRLRLQQRAAHQPAAERAVSERLPA